jgi:hypothetical protein
VGTIAEHRIYDVIGIALVALFGTLSAGWFTLARTQGSATFARWFVDLRLT